MILKADSECSNQSARTRRLIWAFAGPSLPAYVLRHVFTWPRAIKNEINMFVLCRHTQTAHAATKLHMRFLLCYSLSYGSYPIVSKNITSRALRSLVWPCTIRIMPESRFCHDAAVITSTWFILYFPAHVSVVYVSVYMNRSWCTQTPEKMRAAPSEKVSSSMRRMHRFIICMRKVSSGHLPSIDTFYSIQWFCKWTAKTLIGIRGCAGWSRPSLYAYAWRHAFACRGPCIFEYMLWAKNQISLFIRVVR